MERCTGQNWDIYRQEPHRKRSQCKKPTWGCWQPAVPIWEKEFCKVVGSLDWEIFLRKKKFVHLYDNVINWDDSEGKEAFQNAKTRFWSEKHGVPCEILLPDPDLYIDEIEWDSENDFELPSDLDVDPVFFDSDEDHKPVVVFGNSFFVNQAFSPSSWGDYEENMIILTHSTSANHVDPWEHNWGNAFPNAAATGWTGFCNNAWNFIGGRGHADYAPWVGGWNNTWGWNYSHNPYSYGVEPPNVTYGIANEVQGYGT
ncbi:uncharacterized protein LOC111399657 [Olea europaea var. sylvestris]|uniref:uncharacterized protein LOC111399657 n=1 Tax=Olea europaea var. sylvestris TaxID=158386 RepID=UPI000C1D720A|nr:uncharacterized protein LOC111399657 [Olea europaea var. sylvestris]XP_022882862.1 uncharacterized protein LOC111399657 [Olea europaea var. sylvestris]